MTTVSQPDAVETIDDADLESVQGGTLSSDLAHLLKPQPFEPPLRIPPIVLRPFQPIRRPGPIPDPAPFRPIIRAL